jgi:hypothetical protein
VSYTKLFSHIVTSTIWREPKEVKILWITMLALSNKHGEVMASIPGLADMARLTLEETEIALQVLEAPDKYSRTPDHEGRRLFTIEGGWHIVNYRKHRRMASIDEQREMNAARQRRWYEKHKKSDNLTENITVSNGSVTPDNATITHQTDNAEAEAEYRGKKSTVLVGGGLEEPTKLPAARRRSAPVVVEPSNDFLEFWEEYPRKVAQKAAWKAWEKANPPLNLCLASLQKYKKTEQWRRGKEYIPHASTWLNQERWDDEL